MKTMTSQITSVSIVYSTVCLGADQRKYQSSVSLACVGKSPVTGEIHAQRASNAKNVSIWWRHHTGVFHYTWRNLELSFGALVYSGMAHPFLRICEVIWVRNYTEVRNRHLFPDKIFTSRWWFFYLFPKIRYHECFETIIQISFWDTIACLYLHFFNFADEILASLTLVVNKHCMSTSNLLEVLSCCWQVKIWHTNLVSWCLILCFGKEWPCYTRGERFAICRCNEQFCLGLLVIVECCTNIRMPTKMSTLFYVIMWCVWYEVVQCWPGLPIRKLCMLWIDRFWC